MSYWFDPNAATLDNPRPSKGRGISITDNKPIYFHNEADVALFYPPIAPAQTIRRTKPGGENVRKTAALNDKLSNQMAVNKE